MITAEHLTRRFGRLTAVDDASFHLERGEVVGFLGLNGAGKTTTLRMLAGYLPPSDGSVRVAGLDVVRDSLAVREKIGYLPESVPLYREHRVIEMLRFQARLHGLDRATAARRTEEVLERVGLSDRRTTLIGNLSKGLRQRAGLAVALLPDPEVLILDEPTSGLDPLQRLEVRDLVRELASERTVIFSSHILPEVEAVCPRVIVIHQGRIAADGARDALAAELGGGAHVRVELVAPDADEVLRLLKKIRGANGATALGRLGIHHGFRVECAEDLREDVGALAAAKGWALRELSYHAPTLEQLFARLAFGASLDELDEVGEGAGASAAALPDSAQVALHVELGVASSPPPLGTPGRPKKDAYNLNPFRATPPPKRDGSGAE